MQVILKYLNEHPQEVEGINRMECRERDYIVEFLSLDLPLQVVLDFIEVIFWSLFNFYHKLLMGNIRTIL